MNSTVVTLLVITLAVCASEAKTFNRCSLAKEMYSLGVPKSELAIWTCIAQHESSYRTDAVGPTNPNGTRDYGIFQINNRYWCQGSISSSNTCGLSCSSLLTENIKNSVTCARKVKSQQGWTAWTTYSKCSGSLPTINSCF